MPHAYETGQRLSKFSRNAKGLPIYIDILYATIHNAYCRLVIAASQQQPDDVGAGVIGVVAQSVPSAVSYAFLVVIARLTSRVMEMLCEEQVRRSVDLLLRALGREMPNVLAFNQKLDIVANNILCGLVLFAVSQLCTSVQIFLYPELREGEQTLEHYCRWVCAFMDRYNGRTENIPNYAPSYDSMTGGYLRFMSGLNTVLKIALEPLPEPLMGNGSFLLQFNFEHPTWTIFSGFDVSHLTDFSLAFATIFLKEGAKIFVSGWMSRPS